MHTTFLINDTEKVIVPENTKAEYVFGDKTIIISRIEERRMFGGAFVKLAKRGCHNIDYVSSTLSEEELKKFVSENYEVDINNLYRFY